MSTLKKECEVVMLATNERSQIGYLTSKGKEFNDLRHFDRLMPIILDSINYHLYVISNDEIKEGDWCINKYKDTLYQMTKEDGFNAANLYWDKVIATTDTSLRWTEDNDLQILDYHFAKLPQPSKEFIESYIKAFNENNPITKVMVEYRYNNHHEYEDNNKVWKELPKINSSNEISITKVKERLYTTEEVYLLIKKFNYHTLKLQEYKLGNSFDVDDWVKKYL